MKRIIAFALAAVCMTLGTSSARADDADDKALIPESWVPGKFTANVGLTSEYLFRGISQTDDSPAIQGGFDWSLESIAGSPIGLYAGFWGSNVNFHSSNGNGLETDWYAGFQGAVGPKDFAINWKLGGIYYYYPTAPSGSHQNYGELATSLNHDFGPAALTVAFNYSPDYFAASGSAEWLSGKLDIPIWKFTVSPFVGYQWIEDNARFGAPDYWNYGVALSAVVAGFNLTLAYSDTDISKATCPDLCREAVTFTVSRSF
jgi:uncharacterized protein (TIGR02001 family)